MTFPNPNNSSYGYYCNNCKNWIPNGVYHYCTPVNQTYPMYYMYPPYGVYHFDDARLERIEKILEEILELLKKKSGEITDPHIPF